MQIHFTIFISEEGFTYNDELYTSNTYNGLFEKLYEDGCDNSTQLEFELSEGYHNSEYNNSIAEKVKDVFSEIYDKYAENIRETNEALKELEKQGLVQVLVGEDGNFYYELKKP